MTRKYIIMKTKYLFPLLAVLVLFFGCEDSKDSLSLKVPQSANDVSSDGGTLQVDITCDGPWTAFSSAESWCLVDAQVGSGTDVLTIQVLPNYKQEARTAVVTVSSKKAKKEIKISQKASDTSIDPATYHYDLPVIFHVMYKDKTDPKQYVSRNRLSDILSVVNKYYKDKTESVDMNLTFTLATTNPYGETLDNPGVEYIQWPDSYPIDCDDFMTDNTSEGGKGYVKYLWDPNRYINVMVYNFTEDPNSGSVTLGISHLPFTTTGSNSLPGLNDVSQSYLTLQNLAYPYCVSINSSFIDQQSNSQYYNPADITVTLAHELGHYLGLHHVFSEASDGSVMDGCKDTDYCEDTPSYNKVAYDMTYQWAMAGNVPDDNLFKFLVNRENCEGAEFISRNIMDYSISKSDQFTQDQLGRVRHVLMYSPLIPGPKVEQADTRVVYEGPLDLPIRVVR